MAARPAAQTTPTSATGRPMRADARRNRERILAQARDSFTEHGADVLLDDVARRAGVGVATLYRHFPTREALLDAVVREWYAAVLDEAEELAASPELAAALRTFMHSLVDHMSVYRGLVAALVPSMHDQDSALHPSCQVMADATELLLDHARRGGVARADATAAELLQLVSGVAWVCEQAGPSADLDRLLDLTLTGLLAPAAR